MELKEPTSLEKSKRISKKKNGRKSLTEKQIDMKESRRSTHAVCTDTPEPKKEILWPKEQMELIKFKEIEWSDFVQIRGVGVKGTSYLSAKNLKKHDASTDVNSRSNEERIVANKPKKKRGLNYGRNKRSGNAVRRRAERREAKAKVLRKIKEKRALEKRTQEVRVSRRRWIPRIIREANREHFPIIKRENIDWKVPRRILWGEKSSDVEKRKWKIWTYRVAQIRLAEMALRLHEVLDLEVNRRVTIKLAEKGSTAVGNRLTGMWREMMYYVRRVAQKLCPRERERRKA